MWSTFEYASRFWIRLPQSRTETKWQIWSEQSRRAQGVKTQWRVAPGYYRPYNSWDETFVYTSQPRRPSVRGKLRRLRNTDKRGRKTEVIARLRSWMGIYRKQSSVRLGTVAQFPMHIFAIPIPPLFKLSIHVRCKWKQILFISSSGSSKRGIMHYKFKTE